MELIGDVAIAIYEHTLTFDREFEFFWKGPLNLIKVLWFAVSYDESRMCGFD